MIYVALLAHGTYEKSIGDGFFFNITYEVHVPGKPSPKFLSNEKTGSWQKRKAKNAREGGGYARYIFMQA